MGWSEATILNVFKIQWGCMFHFEEMELKQEEEKNNNVVEKSIRPTGIVVAQNSTG